MSCTLAMASLTSKSWCWMSSTSAAARGTSDALDARAHSEKLHITSVSSAPSNSTRLMTTDLPRHWWQIDHGELGSIFLATHQPEPPPTACDGDDGVLFVGAEQAVFALRRDTGAVVVSLQDLTDVRSVQRVDDGLILVIAGDHLAAFHPSGALLWRQVMPDLVDEVQVQLGQVQVTDVSGETYALSVSSGLPVGP